MQSYKYNTIIFTIIIRLYTIIMISDILLLYAIIIYYYYILLLMVLVFYKIYKELWVLRYICDTWRNRLFNCDVDCRTRITPEMLMSENSLLAQTLKPSAA